MSQAYVGCTGDDEKKPMIARRGLAKPVMKMTLQGHELTAMK